MTTEDEKRGTEMKKRLEKKLVKLFLSALIHGPLDDPCFVAWSPSWRAALSDCQLQAIRKMFRRTRQKAPYTLSPSETCIDLFEGKKSEFVEPFRPIPVRRLPPEKVLRCV